MHEKKSFSTRVDEFLGGKGFYIVLFLCIAVIGVSAWLLLFSRFSPLTPDGEGDYVNTMSGTVTPQTPQTPEDPGSADTDPQPEHIPPEDGLTSAPNEPKKETGALTVQDPPGKTEVTPGQEEPDKSDGDEPAPGAAMSPGDLTFVWPVSGEVTTEYSPRDLIYSRTMGDWRTHDGIDIAARKGTKVLSCANGTVIGVYTDDLYGTTVVIDHGAGVVSTCSNLAGEPTVKEGDAVTMSSVIGSVGSTALGETNEAPHLHFSMTVNGETADPTQYLPRR